MTIALESVPSHGNHEPTIAHDSLSMESVSESLVERQIHALTPNYWSAAYKGEFPEFSSPDSLAVFAAEAPAGTPLITRVMALERALNQGFASDTFNRYSAANSAVQAAAQEPHSGWFEKNLKHDGSAYRYISQALLKDEKLDQRLLFPEETEMEIDRGILYPDWNPVHAYTYLDKLRKELASPHPSEAALRFQPFITDLEAGLATMHELPKSVDVPLTAWRDISVCADLFRYGQNYSQEFTELMDVNGPEKLDYLQLIGEINDRIPYAAEAFPERYEAGVKDGMKNLLADAAYAIKEHILSGGETQASIPLKGGNGELPLELHNTEPLELLSALHTALVSLEGASIYSHESAGRNYYRTTKVADMDGAMKYRLLEVNSYRDRHKALPLSVYVRPYGDVTYDRGLEYGRAGEGVEASIGYVIDTSLDEDKLIEVGKHRTPDDDRRISIRLDREGVKQADRLSGGKKDPTQQEGTLSLDVGSVLGRDEWTSTKLGRLLAWGNVLRSRAEGSEAGLNHMTAYFTEEDGDADVFAVQAARMIERYNARLLKPDEIKRLFAGRAALHGASKQR